MKFEKEIRLLVRARHSHTDMINVFTALGYGLEKYQDAFDVALEMDNNNIAKLLYANYNTQQVIVEFTLLAKRYA